MRTILLKSALLLLMPLIFAFGYSQVLRVASYNIRFDNPGDSLDLWQNRKPYVAGIIGLYNIDIFGIQEGLNHQLEDLRKDLKSFEYIGVGRDDGDQKGEYAAIFYDTAVFTLLESGTFWLSQVTGRPNKGWDAALPRICTWGRFRIISSGREFCFFNTHFDHMGEKARNESAKLLVGMIKKIAAPNPAILSGDLNFDEKHPNFGILNNSGILKDAYEPAEFRYAPGGTFTAFDISARPEGRIDHIFITDHFRVNKYAILTNTYNGRYPSDHFAVFSELQIKE